MSLSRTDLEVGGIVLAIVVVGYIANNFAQNITSGFNQAETNVGDGIAQATSTVGTGVAVGAGGALLLLPLLLL